MNEPNTPDDGDLIQPLNSASPMSSEQASCPFYTVIPTESFAINFSVSEQQEPGAGKELESDSDVILPHQYRDSEDEDLESIFTADDGYWHNHTGETDSAQNPGDWVTETDAEKQAAVNSEFQQLLKLNQELRQANEDLYQQVETLTSQLSESEKALQLQKKRSDVTESILKEQAQEFSATQEQIQSLYQQLDTSQQNVQRQETLIETYRAQLEFSQQRLAQLERECALLQSHHQEQSQHLLHSENACKELRTRLMRQQRQTLQFKAALEKCLETSIPSEEEYENGNQSHQSSPRQSHHLRKFKSLLANAQPIKPWSADMDETDTIEDIWNDSPSVAAPWQDEANLESQLGNSSSRSLEEQIDSVIQMFFNSQNTTNSETPTQIEVDEEVGEAVSTWDAKLARRKSFATPLETSVHQDTITVSAEISPPEESPSQPNPIPLDDYWQEISQLTQIETLSAEGQYLEHDDTGSPSPIVYPNRTTKKRDSLAAVELPKFK
jgi:myosin heavy subunit